MLSKLKLSRYCKVASNRLGLSPRENYLRTSSLTTSARPPSCLGSATTSTNGSRRWISKEIPPTSSSLQGPPVSKLVPPGQCQFGEDFESVTLVDRVQVSPTSSVFRFSLPDETKSLKLSTCACLLAKSEIAGDDVIRPYTPISTNALTGYMDFLIKNYQDKGTMSKYLHEIPIGSDDISFKHVPFNVKIQAPFPQKHIVMVAGGTGITPMIQALHAILDKDETSQRIPDEQNVTLLYGSQHSEDILARPILDEWAAKYPDTMELVHILSDEPENSSWTGKRGMIDRELLQQYLPSPSVGDGVVVFVCGPPPLYQAVCGPRDEQDAVSGILADMGFSKDQVYKF